MNIFTDITLPVCPNGLENALQDFCSQRQVTAWEMKSKSREKHLVKYRVEFSKESLDMGFTENQIAEVINRHRTTIIHYKEDYVE